MIPKIIHTAWFGRGPKSDVFKRCMDTWPQRNPDWEIREINEDNFGAMGDTPYIRAVLERGEFVKATELARLVAVHRDGGIYLDCDMQALRSFEGLRSPTCFFVRQQDGLINGAMFGARAGNAALGSIIAGFPADTDGWLSAHAYGPTYLTAAVGFRLPDITVFSPIVAFPYFYDQPDPKIYPEDSYAVHHWVGSWK